MTQVTPLDVARKIDRAARLQWVPISKTRVSAVAQRELVQARVDRIVAHFDQEQMGTPTVSERGGEFFVIDGQHRVEALKQLGWEDRSVQCWVYHHLDEATEAEKFLKLNDTLAVNAFARFRIGVQAGREDECEIDRVVRAQGLVVSMDGIDGAIAAVGTLRRVYNRAGSAVLGRTLRIIRDAYGSPGLSALVIDGLGLLLDRYDEQVDDLALVQRLSGIKGGVNGLTGRAEELHLRTGNLKGHCVAAAAVDIHNAGRGGKKLESWWRAE